MSALNGLIVGLTFGSVFAGLIGYSMGYERACREYLDEVAELRRQVGIYTGVAQ